MVPHILPGKRLSLLLAFILTSFLTAYAQSPTTSGTCAVSATPAQVRGEGLTERFGAIQFQCANFIPASTVSGNITVFLPVSITNRVDANSNALDAFLAVNTGSGLTPTALPGNIAGNYLTFRGLNVVVPAGGNFTLQISGIRGAAYQTGLGPAHPINALLSTPFALSQSSITVANVQTGLFTTQSSAGIYCVGSPAPSNLTVSGFFAAGAAFASTRVTEGFGSAFQPRGPNDDTGTRFIIGFSGFPAGAQIYVPTFVAGSDAQVPTAGGDLGLPQNIGNYVPGSNTLFLSAVQFADSTGAGGYVSSFSGNMNQVSQVTLVNGSGYVVYEVLDANPSVIESAQFPTFITMPKFNTPATASETVTFAPVSNLMTASATAPVPRFIATTPTNDCSIVGDCSANYYPKLTASSANLSLTAVAGQTSNNAYIAIQNAAGGTLSWTAAALYNQGSNWLTLAPASGQNNGTVSLNANAAGLTPGTYTANVTVSGGPAGSASFTITLNVTAAPAGTGTGTTGTGTGTGTPTGATPTVTVSSVENAASFASAPVVPGSLSTLMGSNLTGKSVTVTFDGTPATLLYNGASQINLQVPITVASESNSSMVVTVDGNTATQSVPVSPAWPAIFNPGVLNQDGSVNGPAAPAGAGQIVQIFLTGMPSSVASTASVVVGSQSGLTPLYAGDAPGLPGVQQVNVRIPAGAGGGSTPVAICVTTAGRQFCSTGMPVYVK